MTEPDRYVSRTGERVHIEGREFTVAIHWATVGGRLTPVGVDLRSFTSKTDNEADLSDARPTGGWSEITSPVVRGLRTAEVIEQQRQNVRLLSEMLAAMSRAQRKALGQPVGKHRKAPGPPTRYTDELLRTVVVPTYQMGGRKPSMAVLEALRRHFDDQQLSPDVARHVVQKARRAGLLPAYDRGQTPTTVSKEPTP